MKKIQFIEITPEQLKREIIEDLKTSLLPELKKEMQPKTPPEYITRVEFIKMFNINPSTERNWRLKGVVKAYSIEGRVYYLRKDIEDLMVELNP